MNHILREFGHLLPHLEELAVILAQLIRFEAWLISLIVEIQWF
jgi:hypothetical protein